MNYFKSMYESFISSDYLKNITTLVVGSLFAQIIAFIAIPILSRLYLPEQFGAYSLFITITGIVGLVSSLLYNRAIVLPKEDKDALSLFFASLFFNFLFFIVCIASVYFFYDTLNKWFLGGLFLVLLFPLRVLQIGIFQAIEQISVRIKRYKTNAYIRSSNAFITAGLQLSNNLIYSIPGGLIIGKVISDIIATLSFLFSSQDFFKKHIEQINLNSIIYTIKEYIVFPKYQLLAVLANTLSQGMPIIFLTSFFSLEVAGFYGMSMRILKQPTELIGSSTQQVFYQTSAKLFSQKKSILPLFKSTILSLTKMYVIPMLILILFAPQIFKILLGDQWIVAGNISQIIIVWCFFNFIKPPAMVLFNIFKLQHILMYIETSQFFLRLGALFAGYYFYNSFFASIILYVFVTCLYDIFIISFIYSSITKYENSINSSSKKIIFIISGLGQGGAERVLTSIANEQVRRNIDVEIISGYNNQSAYHIDKKIKVHRIGYKRLESQNLLKILLPVIRRLISMRKILNESKPDVIISFGDSTNVQAIAANKFLRFNSAKHLISIRSNPEKLNLLARVSIKLFYSFADLLIVQSSFVENWAKRKFKRLNIIRLNNPIQIPKKQNVYNKEIDFLHVGTIKVVKNHKSMIKAFHKFQKKINKLAKLVFVGGVESQDLYNSLRKQIKELGLEKSIIFEGPQKDVNKYYQNAKIFILPSLYEGTSNALLEAMSHGIPSITTEYKGSSDVIDNNHNGLIIPLNSHIALSDAMYKLFVNENERRRLGGNAKDFIVKNYDSRLIIDKWIFTIEEHFHSV